MSTIQLDARARLGILSLINQQQGTFGEIALLFDIREKIKFPPEEENKLIKTVPQGTLLNLPAIEAHPPKDIDLEKNEREKLQAIIEGHRTFGVEDVVWVKRLQSALADSV